MTIGEIEKKALESLRPRKEDYEKARHVFEKIKAIINDYLESNGIDGRVELEGSVAKDTWIRTDPELDVFIIFPRTSSWNKETIKNIVEELASKLEKYNPVISYAEHPYIKVSVEGFETDIVPAIEKPPGEKILTAVDRTPMHTRYVKEHTTPELRDEIRLAKRFARRIGVYGAEIRTRGFSGYLLELLVIEYGGFRELLENASNWKPPIIVGKTDRSICGNTPLCIADPTDSKRNVAASVSMKRIAEFSLASTLYLKSPSISFFVEDDSLENIIEDRVKLMEPYYPYIVIVELYSSKPHPPDNFWGMMERASGNMKRILENKGFRTARCDYWCNERQRGILACLLESPFLSPIEVREGPPYHKKEHSHKFILKYLYSPMRGPWVEKNGRLAALEMRDSQHPVDLLKKRINELLVSGLSGSRYDVFVLSWKPELIDDPEAGAWIREFIFGKPKWLLPYYQSIWAGKNKRA